VTVSRPRPEATKPDERHRGEHAGWLRAAVLGANDGIVSTASLVVGVAAGGAGPGAILLAGVAGLVGGAMSMAAGEYVSVSSQADVEAADIRLERWELEHYREGEHKELVAIYVKRGLEPALARTVAKQLMGAGPGYDRRRGRAVRRGGLKRRPAIP
jgi:VIT1/CCC1 family predicted Fe2+/Mn2+ transporter